MKKLTTLLLTLLLAGVASAQSLAGRTYHNANIMGKEIEKMVKEAESKMDEARTEAYAKFEKKKGRKPNEKEKAEIENELEEARKLMDAMQKGMKTEVSVDFLSDTEGVARIKMTVSDEALKAAGVSWAKRKAIKLALAMAPEKSKFTYKVQGNLVIQQEDKDTDTLRLSDDGKFLYGQLDKKTNFKLTRTK